MDSLIDKFTIYICTYLFEENVFKGIQIVNLFCFCFYIMPSTFII